mgnify:CR=1 FL=1
MREHHKLTGRQKAAILLLSLSPDLASKVLKHLKDWEVELITLEIAAVKKIPPEQKNAVIEEFYSMLRAKSEVVRGGIEYAREILERSVGPTKAAEIIDRITASLRVSPFETARRVDAQQLLSVIQSEHPQIIALILAHLRPEQSAMILSGLPQELRREVALRIALMDRTTPEVVEDIEMALERKLAGISSQEYASVGGAKTLAEILSRSDRTTEKSVLEGLSEFHPELADEVKQLMFVFEDIVKLDDRAVQQILKEIEMKDLSLALKGASEDVKAKVFKNMSTRAAEMLKEDMEFLGPVRLRDVEAAQQRIVGVIRKLEEAGQIVISREEEEVVI